MLRNAVFSASDRAPGMSCVGPKRPFAAVQRCGRCRWNTGRSVDVAGTAAADPERTVTGKAVSKCGSVSV
jgi:hypothetical protein